MKSQYCRAREPFSCYSHLIGAVLSAAGLVMLLVRAAREDAAPGTVLSVLLFGLSLVALYSASAVYHHALCGENALRVLKKLDHSMIYVLIAGSYTPIVLRYMEAPAAYIFLAVIWALAAFGIVVKLIWIDAPRLIGTLLYLLMGWAVVFRFDVVLSMPAPAIFLLAVGGIAYTIGGVIYIAKRPNLSCTLGFHELFHLFVLAGSAAHYIMVFWFVL